MQVACSHYILSEIRLPLPPLSSHMECASSCPMSILLRRVECQKLGEDLQQAYRAANQALEEIPAFEDIPKANRKVVEELAEGAGSQAVAAFRNSRGAAGTSDMQESSPSASHDASTNGSRPRQESSTKKARAGGRKSGDDGAAGKLEEGINVAASRARSAAQQVATAVKEEVQGHHIKSTFTEALPLTILLHDDIVMNLL